MPAEGLLEFGGPLVYHAHFMTFTLYLICKHPFLSSRWNTGPLSENGTMNCHDSALVDGTCDTRGSLNGWTLLMPSWLCIGTMGCEPPLQLCRPYKVFSHHFLGARDAQTFVLSVALPIHKRMVRKFLGKDNEKKDRGVEIKKGGPDGAPGLLSW